MRGFILHRVALVLVMGHDTTHRDTFWGSWNICCSWFYIYLGKSKSNTPKHSKLGSLRLYWGQPSSTRCVVADCLQVRPTSFYRHIHILQGTLINVGSTMFAYISTYKLEDASSTFPSLSLMHHNLIPYVFLSTLSFFLSFTRRRS